MIKRNLEDDLKSELLKEKSNKDVLLVEGARQVGKTFLIESVLKELEKEVPVHSFNLEKDLILQSELSDVNSFNEVIDIFKKRGFDPSKKSILFIDEAQEGKKLGGFIRFFKEDLINQTVILSGSSLSRIFTECRYPVGRVKKYRVNPFNFEEYLRALNKEHLLPTFSDLEKGLTEIMHKELLKLFDAFLSVGGMPSVVLNLKENQDQQRMIIYLSQEEDFYRKLPKYRKDLFKKALSAAANLLGSPFSYSKVSENHRIAKELIAELDAWQLVHLIEQKNPNNTTNFHPKVYLYDCGLARQLKYSGIASSVGILSTNNISLRNAIGGLVENATILELTSGLGYLRNISGWKRSSSSDKEVDFILDTGLPIEINSALKVQNKHTKGLIEYLNLYDHKTGVIISGDIYFEKVIDNKTIKNLPVYAMSLIDSVK